MSFMDANTNNEHAENISRPAIQFHRGDLSNSNPLVKNGCYQLPVEAFGSIVGDAWESVLVSHAGGVSVNSYLLPKIHLAVLGFQKRWYVEKNNRTEYLDHYQDGSKSRFRLMALCQELYILGYEEPVLVTVSGMNGKHLEDAFKSFKADVITTAARLAKRRFPAYAFWLPLAIGPKTSVKNNQYITPPQLDLNGKVDQELLEQLFVSDKVLSLASTYWDEAQMWAQQGKPATSEPEVEQEEIPEVVF